MTTHKFSLHVLALAPLASLFVCLPASARQVSNDGFESTRTHKSHTSTAFAGIYTHAIDPWDVFRQHPGSPWIQLLNVLSYPHPVACLQQVENGHFETGTVPSDLSQITNATGWSDANDASADYFAVGGGTEAGVPANHFGMRTPHSGNAYAGIHTYAMSPSNEHYLFREYLETQLLSPMTKGKYYLVRFWAARADLPPAELATNNLGANLSKLSIHEAGVGTLSMVPTPTYANSSVLVSTNWTHLGFYYKAKGGEQYLTIGNFSDNMGTTLTTLGTDSNAVAYYYIDDVSVQCVLHGPLH